jgi:hypothetical protein
MREESKPVVPPSFELRFEMPPGRAQIDFAQFQTQFTDKRTDPFRRRYRG